MNMIQFFLAEEIQAMIKICKLFHAKYIYINGTKYRVPHND